MLEADCMAGSMVGWNYKGSTRIEGLFGWWWDSKAPGYPESTIGEVVASSFKMYAHHLRRINNRDNLGWLRNMVHSLGQQVVREDPLYYRCYVCLRTDHQWRLISYPY